MIATVFPDFSDVWRIPKAECDSVGDRWEKAIKTVDQLPWWALKIIEGLPWISAGGITAIVLGWRANYMLRSLRSAKRADLARREDVPPQREFQAPPVTPTNGRPNEEGATVGGGYAGERDESFASIDGSEAAAVDE